MKILLCGDYSSVHSELSSALKQMGHDVTVFSDGDGSKNFPADIKLTFEGKRRSLFGKVIYILLDLLGLYGFFSYRSKMKEVEFEKYDIVQIINPVIFHPFGALGSFLLLRRLRKVAGKFFLCGMGDDSYWVAACLRGKYKYSAMDRLTLSTFPDYYYSLKYVVSPAFYFLNRYAVKISNGIITGLDDYKIAYEDAHPNVRLIRLPISKDRFTPPKVDKNKSDKVTIFHAWQKGKESKKGNDILDAAAKKVMEAYGESKVKYIVASGLPYDEFIKSYNACDIYLDQVYSYDRGVSAALGMCAAKVVFSGFELEKRFSLLTPENIKINGVNATSDIDDLVAPLAFLIENPDVLTEISNSAYTYALDNFEASKIAKEYLEFWAKS